MSVGERVSVGEGKEESEGEKEELMYNVMYIW